MKYEEMLARTAYENQLLKFAADKNDPYAITYHPKDLMGGVSTVPVTRDASKPMTQEERSKFYTDSYHPTLKPEIRRDAGSDKTDAQKQQERQQKEIVEAAKPPATAAVETPKEEELSPWESYKRDWKLYEYADPPQEIKTETSNPPEIKGLDKKRIADAVDTGSRYKEIYQEEYNKLENKYPNAGPFSIFNGIMHRREQKAAENTQARMEAEKKQKELNEQVEKLIADYMTQQRAGQAISQAPSVETTGNKVTRVGEE